MEDLRQSCYETTILDTPTYEQTRLLAESAVIAPDGANSILTLHSPETDLAAESAPEFATIRAKYSHVKIDVADIRRASSDNPDLRGRLLEEIRSANSVVILVYDPRKADADNLKSYRDWLGFHFSACGSIADTVDSTIEYFIRSGFPCELGIAEAPIAANYDNGIALGNLLLVQDERSLDLYLYLEDLAA